MRKGKDLTTATKKKSNLLNHRMSSLEISKELCRNHRTLNKAVEIITKLRTGI